MDFSGVRLTLLDMSRATTPNFIPVVAGATITPATTD